MSLGTPNRDGGKTSESAHLRALTKGFRGEVISGLNVSQRGAGANMSVDIAIGDAIIPRSDGTYSHPAYNDAVLNQAIATADPSNPRRDIVVLYVDYTQTPSTGVSNNTNGVIKVKVVAGTPAGSPVDPTDTAIQSSVGSGNPFIKLARARVGAGVTSIGNSVIDDLRRMATAHVQGGWLYEYLYTWVYVAANQFKIAAVDARAQFPVGTKIQVYQGGVVKYFVVTAATFSTDTTVTIDGRGTYTLANDIIDHPAYSYMLIPQGWPWGGVLPNNLTLDVVQSVLSTAAGFSTSATTYQDAGMKLTLPAVGTWLLITQARCLSSSVGQFGIVGLKNFTAGTLVPETERLAAYAAAASERQNAPMFAVVTTAAANSQVGFCLKSGGAYTVTLENDPNGYCSLLAIRIG